MIEVFGDCRDANYKMQEYKCTQTYEVNVKSCIFHNTVPNVENVDIS